MKKVFIFGYYGFKNIGDEAILTGIIKTIKEVQPSTKIYALSYNVKYTEKIHGICGVRRNSLVEIIRTIQQSDLVISGGGSLLQDVTSSRSLIYYLAIIFLAKIFKRPVIFYSNGFGPIHNRFNQFMTSKIVNRVNHIILRDEASKKLMQDIGITKEIEVTTDTTFVLEGTGKARVHKILREENIPTEKPLVGISVRPWQVKENFIEVMAKFADYLCDKGIGVVFIPMQASKDVEISEKIIHTMKKEAYMLKGEYKPEELLGIIGEMEVLVGMRLHALIFASIANTPMLGLEYDPKIPAFLDSVKQRNMGKVKKLDHVSLCIEFDRLWEERAEQRLQLSHTVSELKKTIYKNREVLRKMLK